MNLYYQILNSLSAMLIATSVPAPDVEWESDYEWHAEGNELVFQARNRSILSECTRIKNGTLYAPLISQGFHEFYVNGQLVSSSGDAKYSQGHELYNILDVPCENIPKGELIWRVRTQTGVFARLDRFPSVTTDINFEYLTVRGVSISMAGGIIFISFFLLVIFANYFPIQTLSSMFLSGFFIGLFFILINPSYFFISLPPLVLHRLHDIVLWTGMIFSWHFLREMTATSRWNIMLHTLLTLVSVTILITAQDLNQAQVGSNLASITNLFAIIVFTIEISVKLVKSRTVSFESYLSLGCILIFVITGGNDLALTLGLVKSIPVFTVGFPFAYALMSSLANMKIKLVQAERDHLAKNLEKEVASKTSILKERTEELQSTVNALQQTQAELVHSSKMASLGTLAAGIAHEINNALNYPMGAIPVLVRMFSKSEVAPNEIVKAKEIVSLMKDGLYLTADIIKNLKSYSSNSSTRNHKINLKKILDNTIGLSRNHLKSDISLNIKVPDNYEIEARSASLSQIFMNIIHNAADAMEGQKELKSITLDAFDDIASHIITISDTGPGIPQGIKERIFDPFFTTKGEGKGTGLGLFIVNKEVQSLGGKIVVDSAIGEGTTFKIIFPKNADKSEGVA